MLGNSFQAGVGQIDITPPLGTRINGDFITHFAVHIHDKLYARTLLLKNHHKTIGIVVVDICMMSQEFIDKIKSMITDVTNIPSDNILISSTHTHAGGAVEEAHVGGVDMAYRKKLPKRIVESVQKAKENLRPAKITYGAVDVSDHVLCRRYYMTSDYNSKNPVSGKIDTIKTNPFGQENFIDRPVSPVDPQLSYLAVKGIDNKWICVLGNYSLHYVGDWKNGTITSDYFGVFAKQIMKGLNADDCFVGIMSNGTSGDINIWDFQEEKNYPKENFEKSKKVGTDLANKVSASIKNNEYWEENPALTIKNESVTLKRRKPVSKELAQAQEIIRHSNYQNIGYSDEDLRKIYAREQILLNEFPDTKSCPLQVIKIGDLFINGLPGEFFAETGRWIKKNSPTPHCFSIGLANDNIGYVPPPNQIKLGGYETWRCRYSCMEIDAEIKLRTKIKDMCNEIS